MGSLCLRWGEAWFRRFVGGGEGKRGEGGKGRGGKRAGPSLLYSRRSGEREA